jgi:hypothetical protein
MDLFLFIQIRKRDATDDIFLLKKSRSFEFIVLEILNNFNADSSRQNIILERCQLRIGKWKAISMFKHFVFG